VLTKERSTGTYRLSAYFVGKVLAETPLELVMPILFSVITYWMVGLADDGGSFVFFVVIMCLFVLMGSGVGLLIGAIMVDVKKALTLSTIVVLGSVLLGTHARHRPHTHMTCTQMITSFVLRCVVVLQAGSSSARTT
jgi:ABC-type multidrug transport system permease subunit